MFWLVCPFLKKTAILQASPTENMVFNEEYLYTATYHYNKKEGLSLLWK